MSAPRWLVGGVMAAALLLMAYELVRLGTVEPQQLALHAGVLISGYLALGLILARLPMAMVLSWLCGCLTWAADAGPYYVVVAFLVTLAVVALMGLGAVIVHLVIAVVVGVGLLTGSLGPIIAGMYAVVVAVGLVLGLLLRQGQERLRLARLAARRQDAELARVRRQEKMALARELHDAVGHELTVIAMQTLAFRTATDLDPDTEQFVEVIDASTRSALTQLRHLLDVLRTEGESPVVALDAPVSLQQEAARAVAELQDLGFVVRSTVDHDLDELDTNPLVRRTVARLLQESVTNIAKHAPDRADCSVTLTGDADSLRVQVRNAISPVPTRPKEPSDTISLGLQSMRERLTLVGGTLQVGRTGNTWKVDATVPLHG